jgi:hypothetical protein
MNELKKMIAEKGEIRIKASKGGELIFSPVLSRKTPEKYLELAESDIYTLQSVGWAVEVLA